MSKGKSYGRIRNPKRFRRSQEEVRKETGAHAQAKWGKWERVFFRFPIAMNGRGKLDRVSRLGGGGKGIAETVRDRNGGW